LDYLVFYSEELFGDNVSCLHVFLHLTRVTNAMQHETGHHQDMQRDELKSSTEGR